MSETTGKYIVEKVRKIDERYYLIKLNRKYFVVDFANPRDVRYYFPLHIPKIAHEWTAYDVTGEEEKYPTKSKPFIFRKKFVNIFALVYGLYVITLVLFPRFNLSALTYDERILNNWILVLIVIGAGALLVFLKLFFYKQSRINLVNKKKYLVKVSGHQELTWTKRIGIAYIALPLFLVMLVAFGLANSSYSQLVAFIVLPLFLVLFGRFTGFPDTTKQKFEITEI